MNKEEIIEALKDFEKSRVEQLKEPSKNLFYAIMKIADERDKYEKILYKIKEWLEEDLKQQYRDCGHRNNIIREVYNKLNELLEEIE